MAKKAKFTEEQRQHYAELVAEGLSNVKIAIQMGITRQAATNLRNEIETIKVIERVRLTEALPRKIDMQTQVMMSMIDVLQDTKKELRNVQSLQQQMSKAMHRLQVENKNYRQTRKQDRDELRKLRRELHRVRGH